MDKEVTEESWRAGRYVIVRWVSRGGDVIIYAVLLYVLGLEYLILAFIVSSIWNYLADFFGQKLWAFKSRDTNARKLFGEFAFYMAVRGGNIMLAGATYLLLVQVFGVRWLIAAIIIIAIFWPLGFVLYRWIFVGSIRDFPSLLRKLKEQITNSRPA